MGTMLEEKCRHPGDNPGEVKRMSNSLEGSWREGERRGGGKVPACVRLGCHICTDSCLSENYTLTPATHIAYLKLTEEK